MKKKILLVLILVGAVGVGGLGVYLGIGGGQGFFEAEAEIEIDESVFTAGNDYLDSAIQNYFLSQRYFSWKTKDGSRNFCIFQKLDSKNNLFPLYLWVRCGEFVMQDNELKEESGISLPVKIDYPNELSFLDLEKFSHVAPGDGSKYSEGIKNIFPLDLQRRIKDFDSKIINQRIKDVARNNFNLESP